MPIEEKRVPVEPESTLGAPSVESTRRGSTNGERFARIAPALAAALLAISLFLPYWSLVLHAPQYPEGLDAIVFTSRMEGDVSEIDELNHYIGMMKLGEAGRLERDIAPFALSLLIVLGLGAALLRTKWAIVLAVPIVVFPVAFVADLYYWLNRAGHELDPHAPLSSSIRPFTPHLLGVGHVGQFATTAQFEAGYYLSVLAALLVLVAIILRLRQEPT